MTLPPSAENPTNFWTAIGRLWRGEYPLRTAFWSFFVVGSLIALLAAYLLGMVFVYLSLRQVALMQGLVVFWGYVVIAAVGVWRSANASDPTYRAWAKFAVIVLIGITLWRLYDGGGSRILDALASN